MIELTPTLAYVGRYKMMINKKRITIALSSENVRRIKAIAAKRKTWVGQLLALEIKKIIREDKRGEISKE